ncbi:hypothetical protein FQR65_LT05483 [Abscondita terminalis]|nr:hypothetical protein FQR65_LT05483 [Abscondita terminalis]
MLSTAACVLITWTSPTIPLLTSPNSPIGVKLTNEEVSWVVSALALGMMPGCIVVTLLIDRVGRKKTLLLCGFLMFLPWILIIFANSFAMLLIARFIGGIGGGIGMGVAPLYIGEISQKKHRGALCSMLSIGFVLGTVLMYSIGPFVSYTTLAIFCASIPVIYILAFSFMPDSPYYLIKSNQRQAALDALTYLVLTGNVEEWLNEIECAIQNEEVPKLKLLWREKNYRKSFMIILVIFAKSFEMLLVARFIGGIGGGIGMGVSPLYIGEISQKEHRGTLCSMAGIGLVLGTVLMYSIGPFVSYTTLAVFCASIPVIYIVAFSFMPDSPYYLIKSDQRQAALDALTFLSSTEDIEQWHNEIEFLIQNEKVYKLKQLWSKKNYRKSFMIILVLKTIQEFSGIYVISAHLQPIMETSQTSLSSQISSLIFAAIQIPCVVTSSFLVDKVGRKPLLIISASGCALTLIGEGVYFYLKDIQDMDLSNVYFFPTLCLTLYFVMISFGISTMAHVAAGELFPSNAKKVGGAMFAFYTGLLAFISNKIFNPIVENWGMHVAFWIFAGVCGFGICFGVFVLPETKGTILTVASCALVSWASPTIPLLTSLNSPIGVTLSNEAASWVVSALPLGMMAGGIILSILIDRIGRKKVMLLSGFFMSIPWLLIIFARSLAMLLAGRVLCGFGSGIAIGIVPLYIGEISEKKHRGALCSLTSIGLVLATMLMFAIGPFVSFTALALFCACIPLIFIVSSYFIPDSPYYLIKSNKREATVKALSYLASSDNVEEWLKEIESTVENDEASDLKLNELWNRKNYRKSLMIIIALKTIQELSGLFVISGYIQTIMEESQTSLSPETSSLIFAAIQIPCVVISAFLIDKLGRKPLLIISTFGCTLTLLGEGVYFYLMQMENVDLSKAHFIPTLCLTLYFIMTSFGISTIAYVAAGELFPPNAKKIGGAVFAFYTGVLSFTGNKIFNPIVEKWGLHVVFWIFACVCGLGEEASWIVSTQSLGMMPGSIAVIFLIDKIGRKKTMLLSGILLFMPWLLVIFSKSFAMLLTARLLGGFGGGITIGVVPLYIGEISEKENRGALSSLTTIGLILSTVVIYAMGPFVSYTTLAIFCASVPAIFVITSYFIPDSPYYLIKRKQTQAAQDALKYLASTENIKEWQEEIESSIEKDEASKLKLSDLFFKRTLRKPFVIIIGLKTLQQLSGVFVISSYIQTVMEQSQTSLSAETSSVIFAAIQIPCVIISAWLVDIVGRRILLAISASGCAIALIGEGIYFYLLQEVHADLTSVHFLPTLCLTVYLMMIPIGLGTLLYVVLGELFTTKMKKIGGSVFAFYSGLLSFVSVKIFNGLSEACGMYTTFWIFSCVCILGVLFGLFVLPETKGKSFEQIQDMLNGSKKIADSHAPDSAVISHM